MGKKKRQFIDKKKAQNFSLVHRSQRDPLKADEDSAQHVLVPIDPVKQEERLTYGIYYADNYDYMQHLRTRGEGPVMLSEQIPSQSNTQESETVSFGNLLLPSAALPSKYEEEEGMLGKGVLPKGPQPDWDPDIVAALDDDVDFDDPDNFLVDDFMKLANSVNPLNKKEKYIDEEEYDEDEEWETTSEVTDGSDIDSDNLLSDDDDFGEEETKSRFTNYSMTSSVIRRSQGLKTLDDRFEKVMEEYDEDEIGCIDHDEVTGTFDINNDLVKQVMDEFIDQQKKLSLSENKDENEDNLHRCEVSDDEDDVSDEELFAQFEKKPKEKWDCESIISTYSNLYNHPKLIVEQGKTKKIQLHKHTGIPLGVFSEKIKDAGTNESCKEIVLNNIRNKNETPEEKRLRKQEVKEQRKNRRCEKKINKQVFKSEFQKQEKVSLNSNVQKGIKM